MLDGGRPRLRLPLQRLLAGRRHDPVVLGGQHGASSTTTPSSTCTTATGSSTPGPRSARPAKVGPTAQVHRSLISHGCVIDGTVVNSVLSPGVRVDVGAVVRDSIVMFDSVIRSGAVVDRAILDKEVVVGPGRDRRRRARLRRPPNKQEPGRLNTGITVVGKRAVIPRGARIGRNVKVAADVRSTDFTGRVVQSGESVDPKRPRTAAAEPAANRRPRRTRPRPATAPERAGGRRPRAPAAAAPTAEPPAALSDPDSDRPRPDRRRQPDRRSRRRLPGPCHPPSRGAPARAPGRRRALARASWASTPADRADRDGVTVWDLVLDGRRRFDLRVTVILDPALALICWVHFAPPIGDAFRKSYRKLLRWNDEFPFVKFSVAEDERPVLATEIAAASASTATSSGWRIARSLAIADQLLEESARLAVDRRTDPRSARAVEPRRGAARPLRRPAGGAARRGRGDGVNGDGGGDGGGRGRGRRRGLRL